MKKLIHNFLGHFYTITKHKSLVMKHCFKCGLYRQGLMHDMTKYYPCEFITGVKYYQGNRSPNVAEKLDIGYSAAWLHHKGRNKHHFEYWIDYSPAPEHKLVGNPMPVKYVVEMFCDRVAASKTYQKEKYTDRSALEYYNQGTGYYVMHEKTAALLKELLEMLANEGEDVTFKYIKNVVLKKK